MHLSHVSAALVSAFIGFGSTVALILAAAAAVGATPAQTASWLCAVSVAKALGTGALSWRFRQPIILAWSTPAAALVAASQGYTMPQAAGAFLVAGLVIAALGLVRPLADLVARIPDAIAAGMLAGVLLPFGLRLAPALGAEPWLVGILVAAFLLVRRWRPALAVLAAIGAGLAAAYLSGAADPPGWTGLPRLVWIPPEVTGGTILGLAIPVALVTMATQNLPGFAVLRAHGYAPPTRAALVTTGALSAATAPFGAQPVSMAAITAAICMGDDVDPNPATRWRVGLAYMAIWLTIAALSPLAVAAIEGLPPDLVTGLVGLALLGPLSGALGSALTPAPTRFAATVTVAVTASGLVAFGVGAAFWGLVAGLVVHGWDRWGRT